MWSHPYACLESNNAADKLSIWDSHLTQSIYSNVIQSFNLCRNEPNVHFSKKESNSEQWRGATLTVTILGNWQYYRSKILKYLRQIAVITPYAQFQFMYTAIEEKNNINITFSRRTDKMPKPPEVQYSSTGPITLHSVYSFFFFLFPYDQSAGSWILAECMSGSLCYFEHESLYIKKLFKTVVRPRYVQGIYIVINKLPFTLSDVSIFDNFSFLLNGHLMSLYHRFWTPFWNFNKPWELTITTTMGQFQLPSKLWNCFQALFLSSTIRNKFKYHNGEFYISPENSWPA